MKIPFLSNTKTHCRHQTKDGKQCKATLQKGKDYCFFHDPDRAPERTAARRQGGITRTRSGPLSLELAAMPLKQSSDVGQFLGQLVTQVCLGNVEVRQGTGIAFITTCMMQAFDRAQRDAENAVLRPLPGNRPDKMPAELLPPWHMKSPDAFQWPPDSALPEALRSYNRRRDEPEPDEIDDSEPDAQAGTAELKTVSQTLPRKGGTPSHPDPDPKPVAVTPAAVGKEPHASTAGDGCATRATKPAAVTITDRTDREERRTTEDDHRRDGESFRQCQDRVLAKLDRERRQSEQQPEVPNVSLPHSRPSASGNNNGQALPDKRASLSNAKLETGNLKLELFPATRAAKNSTPRNLNSRKRSPTPWRPQR
jgi:hypothetical protein